MDASKLYENLDAESKRQLRNLAEEIQKRYSRGSRTGEPQGRVILFLGAAVNYHAPTGFEEAYSQDKRPPIAGELANILIEDIFKEEEDSSRKDDMKDDHLPLSYVAQYYEEINYRSQLIETVAGAVDGKEPSPILKALARMNFKYIITTNYDHLFEDALTAVGKSSQHKGVYRANKTGRPKSTYNVPEKDITVDKPFLYKFHGDIRDVFNENGDYIPENDAIVITDDDYLNFILRMSQVNDNKEKPDGDVLDLYPIPQVINETFAGRNQNTFLFVGYGLQDYNLRLIFKTTLWSKDNNTFNTLQKWSISLNKHRPIQEFWTRNHRVTFIEHNIWSAIPFLYKEIFNEEMPLQ